MRESFLACPIDVLTMADTVELARSAMHSHQRLQHVALNVAKFVSMRFDPVLAADVANSDVGSEHWIKAHTDELGDIERNMLQTLVAMHRTACKFDSIGHRQDINGACQK